ncbi:DUF3604 domain-containing protein [bacterium]|nr:DUF3604 domain-containing protein [bacterium]
MAGRKRVKWALVGGVVAAALLAAACEPNPPATTETSGAASTAELPPPNPLKNAYFGDLHVHTRNSFDAYIFNVRATPDDAYNYARGQTIKHAAGFDVRLTDKPLDFLAVTDHAEYLGVLPAINTPGHPFSQVPYAGELFSTDLAVVNTAFRRFGDSLRAGKRMAEFEDMSPTRSAWAEIKAAAERHNDPGRFTSFIGYEYTSPPEGRNLHRNVIFAGSNAPDLPFSALESQDPSDLWTWMDEQRALGNEALAIPHNSNGSDGRMFERTKWNGQPIDQEWADRRIRNEPLVEVTQVKGTSETHPLLSPNDEFAGFEIMEWYIGSATPITKFEGGYVRDALRAGIEMQARDGYNPFKFGLIGSSDTHNAAGSFEEPNYFSKVGIMDATPERRGSTPPEGNTWETYTPPDNVARYSTWGASGLTGVWAEENTRPSIYAGLRRKETFATTGPRIKVRFFAGPDLASVNLGEDAGLRAAYDKGVPMGGDLVAPAAASPDFLVWAIRDPDSAPLQRVQIIKGWTGADGKSNERIYDVACSDGGAVNPATNRCADNGATVDIATCAFSADKGDAELSASWKDPDFDPKLHAFYYVRVLENPTCRWSTWDAVRAGIEPNPALEKTIQERAYSSPIWYVPTGG